MMQFMLTIHGEVDDETEATTIRTAIDTAMDPFSELDLRIESRCTISIPVPPPPS